MIVLSADSRCVPPLLSVDGSTHLLVLSGDNEEESVCDPILYYLMWSSM